MGFDVETGGPIPGKHPLLAVGLCVYQLDKQKKSDLLHTCEIHLEADILTYDETTLKFWKDNQIA